MRKRISVLSIVLIVLSMQFATLASAFEKRQEPEMDSFQTFAMSVPNVPLISDFSSNDNATQDVLNLFMAGLVRIAGNYGGVVPEIASSWEISQDGKTYTFYLRQAEWDDGTYVTASDFVSSWLENIKNKQDADLFIISGAEQYAQGIVDKEEVGIKALNDSTLQVTFIEADPMNISFLAEASFYPKKQGLQTDEIRANGPYQIVRQENDMIQFVKSPTYWDHENVILEEVYVTVDPEFIALNLYEAGEYDFVYIADAYNKEMYKASDEFAYIEWEGQAVLKRDYVRNARYHGFRSGSDTFAHFNVLELKWAYINGRE